MLATDTCGDLDAFSCRSSSSSGGGGGGSNDTSSGRR